MQADSPLRNASRSGAHTGKKELDERVHDCSSCGYITDRDVAAAIVVEQRGLAQSLGCGSAAPKAFQDAAVGQTVSFDLG